ncbi:MAG: hypothetical protein HC861_02690, partial [Rhodospirillaceae bacterium]|nr:hypothetical protein [Rhodospirillaceae bacterium]
MFGAVQLGIERQDGRIFRVERNRDLEDRPRLCLRRFGLLRFGLLRFGLLRFGLLGLLLQDEPVLARRVSFGRLRPLLCLLGLGRLFGHLLDRLDKHVVDLGRDLIRIRLEPALLASQSDMPARHDVGRDPGIQIGPDDDLARSFPQKQLAVASAKPTRSILPLMFIGLPSFYGAWMHLFFGLTQHVGLAEDVLDHRLNCRTVYMNPIVRFLYLNMNYHVEHHMFPMVPYHRLPELHEEMKADTPKPYNGFLEAYREIIPT